MATVFVAREHGRLVVVAQHQGNGHAVIPFKDGSALVSWTGDDITPALLEEVPTADMDLGANQDQSIDIFATMLSNVLYEHFLLRRVSGGNASFMKHEIIVATKEGVWRIDHAFQTHRGAYACIGNGARPAEAVFGELMNSYKDVSVYSVILHALRSAGDFDTRTKGPYRCHIIRLLVPNKEQMAPETWDPFTLPLQPKLNIRD